MKPGRMLGLVLLVVLAGAGIPASTSDTESYADANEPACYPYDSCAISGQVGDHLGQGPSPGGVQEEPTYWHSNCLICSTGTCHNDCGLHEEDQDVQEAYAAALRGIETGDVELILHAAPGAREYVVWNSERR